MDAPQVAAAAAAAAAAGYCCGAGLLRRRRGRGGSGWADPCRSVASSGSPGGGGNLSGANVYESERAVHEYLHFHYGENIIPYDFGPTEALLFAQRVAEVCKKHAMPHRRRSALDVGCAVGGSSFDLSRTFSAVLGIDFSAAFVAAAGKLKRDGRLPYQRLVCGEVFEDCVARVPEGSRPDRCEFAEGDACALGTSPLTATEQFDCILAANLLCRLPDPQAFLAHVVKAVNTSGILVLVSPYSWLPEYTDKARWLGGKRGADGATLGSFDAVHALLAPHFTLEERAEMPFLIREHARKFAWAVSECTVWRRRA